MRKVDFVIIGGGPAGLSAAYKAAEAGLSSVVIERDYKIGGQLVKQTHMFFGSEKQYAKTRGIDIAKKLIENCEKYPDLIEFMTNTTVTGMYDDYVMTLLTEDKYHKIKASAILVATGASEKFMLFENNDLPGIYGAGAVQTLMNVHGVLPGSDVVMVGSGNIGLIVSYQLLQAGVNVKMVLEAGDHIGGYKVHASKIKRLGVQILTNHSVKRANGEDTLEEIEMAALDNEWNFIEGTEKIVPCDALCISVGLSPLSSVISMLPIKMKYVSKLGGNVPVIDQHHETTMKNVFVAGDVCGVEEASSAIVEGALTGLYIAKRLGYEHPNYKLEHQDLTNQLNGLRSGPFGKKTMEGLKELRGKIMLDKTGVPSEKLIKSRFPSKEYHGVFKAVTECYEEIPCNPCETSCPFDAITVGEDINTPPKVDFDKCTGCGICVYNCPGLAIINVKIENENAVFRIPYEFYPLPEEGMIVKGVNRAGEPICDAKIVRIKESKKQDKTVLLTVHVPKKYLYDFITIRRVPNE